MFNEFFRYDGDQLMCEGIAADELAGKFGTPLYVYSAGAFRKQYREIADSFSAVKPLVCYSIKSCSNLSILKLLKEEGAAFDCVSKGEVMRALKIGADPKTLVFAGVGKTEDEIEHALRVGILMFNVESESELKRIAGVASRLKMMASVALRLLPDVDPKVQHAYTSTGAKGSKFGVDLDTAERCLSFIKSTPSLALKGIHFHIGSGYKDPLKQAEAVQKVAPFIKQVRDRGFPLEFLNVGGGFGISYDGSVWPKASEFAKHTVPAVKELGLRIALEPGRYIAGNSAIILARVHYVKESLGKTFAITDAAMNDLIRPSLYQAYHRIWPTRTPWRELKETEGVICDVVGPICESGDFLAKDRRMTKVKEGDCLAIFSAGAY
ncbi:MAG: diaminopimelate decarboxylase, partial [Planctomycetes bacterium]|nr:diaminopimelate decarboxylase [Planctomycetota bacterium]